MPHPRAIEHDPAAGPHPDTHPGDIPPDDFRRAMHRAADLMADYLAGVGTYPVRPPVQPGDVRKLFPATPPEEGADLDALLDDYKQLIEPNTTHWNHPGFMAYFAVTGSGPGIIGEALAGALNVNAMLWRTGPAPTELEELCCDWLRQLLGLPAAFRGHINDTASIGSMLGIAAARHRAGFDVRQRGMTGRSDLPRLTVYASDQAHSSIDKACVALGIGLDGLRKVPCDEAFRMRVDELERMIRADRAAGCHPIAVVATVGTTSTTAIDPPDQIAAIAQRENMWFHVDGAYAVSAGICPEFRAMMPGIEHADSIVFNPHKWMFVPVDCSVLLVRDPALLREAFSIVPAYLTTTESDVTNLMDYGVQLGRRFRALKLWMVLRAFGAEGIRARIRNHCRLGQEFAAWVRAAEGFELLAPVNFSTVCFRAVPPGLTPEQQDAFNERVLTAVNAQGPVFVSHTALRGRFVMRLTVGNLRTRHEHLQQAWRMIRDAHATELARL